jgi:hypothetical protein
MRSYFFLFLVLFFSRSVAWGGPDAQWVECSDGGKTWGTKPVEIVKPAKKADAVDGYGGFAGHPLKATGYFYVTQSSGKWWLVDPEGGLFIMKGVNSVQARRAGRSDETLWAKETGELLNKAGFNTLGRWSDAEFFKQAKADIPWCSTTTFMGSYAKRRPAENGEGGYPHETIPVFDKEWPEFCTHYAEKQLPAWVDDPWLIGHFSDNELPFRPDALSNYLALPKDDPGHQAAVDWMRDNRVTESKIKDGQVQKDFLEVVARRYFETVAAALKKADPHHLYLGSRLHGRCISEPVIRAAGACDVISINYYHRWTPEKERMAQWEQWSGRPFFVSEFYAMKVASQSTEPEGVGFRVYHFEDAAAFYQTHTASLLKEIPSCVGWHWFKYADDDPDWQKGIVGNDGAVHEALLDGMKVLNEQAYSLRGLR